MAKKKPNVTALVEAAMKDSEGATEEGAAAAARLEHLAWDNGWTKEQTTLAETWADVGEMARQKHPSLDDLPTNGPDMARALLHSLTTSLDQVRKALARYDKAYAATDTEDGTYSDEVGQEEQEAEEAIGEALNNLFGNLTSGEVATLTARAREFDNAITEGWAFPALHGNESGRAEFRKRYEEPGTP